MSNAVDETDVVEWHEEDGDVRNECREDTLTVKMETKALIGKGTYKGADKSLARPGRKQATVTEDFDVHKSYLLS